MDELLGWLKLDHTPGIGPVTINALLTRFADAQTILQSSPATLRHAGLSMQQIDALRSSMHTEAWQSRISRLNDWLENPLNHLIHVNDNRYPPLLRQLPDAPALLYITGDPEVLSTPSLAFVGSRKSAAPTLQICRQLAADLAQRGITITSGLALGVDAAAHTGALDVKGLTIAVAGTGLDRVYPARHRQLAQDICESGALVSELPLGHGPLAHHFPRRNRIISGLSLGVVVIEAARKSGSLITARHASEQGREVMVLPGSVKNPLAHGCHELIRSGGILVQSANDILLEIALQIDTDPRLQSGSPPDEPSLSSPVTDPVKAQLRSLLDCLGYEPASIDTLVIRTGRASSEIAMGLIHLEIEGKIVSLSGGRYARC